MNASCGKGCASASTGRDTALNSAATPVKREPRPGKPQPAPVPEKRSRGGKIANAVLALLCALLLAGGAFGYVTLDGKLQEKQAEIDRLQEKTAFFDRNAVCVNDDGSMLYHRYGCARLEPDQCRIYSRKTAEAGGYEPCPDCFGS